MPDSEPSCLEQRSRAPKRPAVSAVAVGIRPFKAGLPVLSLQQLPKARGPPSVMLARPALLILMGSSKNTDGWEPQKVPFEESASVDRGQPWGRRGHAGRAGGGPLRGLAPGLSLRGLRWACPQTRLTGSACSPTSARVSSPLPGHRGFRSSLPNPASHAGPSASPHTLAPAAFPAAGAVGTRADTCTG